MGLYPPFFKEPLFRVHFRVHFLSFFQTLLQHSATPQQFHELSLTLPTGIQPWRKSPNVSESQRPRQPSPRLTLLAPLIMKNLRWISKHRRRVESFGQLLGLNDFWTGWKKTPKTARNCFLILLRMPRMRDNANTWQRAQNLSSTRK